MYLKYFILGLKKLGFSTLNFQAGERGERCQRPKTKGASATGKIHRKTQFQNVPKILMTFGLKLFLGGLVTHGRATAARL